MRYFITFACYVRVCTAMNPVLWTGTTICPEAAYSGWNLWAAHVRSNHVQVVMEADVRPERAMNAFKSYASRGLNLLGSDEPDRKRWARHGSTRWLWKDADVREAIQYVVSEQGEPMAVFAAKGL
jgi:REP element-mobilizing transposase RayT